MKKYIQSLSICFFIFSCTPKTYQSKTYQSTDEIYKKQSEAYAKQLEEYPLKDSGMSFVGTVNFTMRKPNFVIIHHTAQNSCDETLKTFTIKGDREVSAHYVICKSGTVYHMLNDLLRAHHAGISKWGSLTDLNSSSIGIEIDNNGNEPFTDAQINSLLLLLKKLKDNYKIPVTNFLGHADVAPGRKVDPGKYFPWQKLANDGFGVWYDTTNVAVSQNFDALQALRTIGYNTAKPNDAVQAFKLHFNAQDTTYTITETDKKILTSLLQKF